MGEDTYMLIVPHEYPTGINQVPEDSRPSLRLARALSQLIQERGLKPTSVTAINKFFYTGSIGGSVTESLLVIF